MNFVLNRRVIKDEAIIGWYNAEGESFQCFSLEDVKDVIPAGKYKIVKQGDYSKRAGYPRLMPDPPGRAGILIHSGTDVDDTLGCLVLGYTYLPTTSYITSSKVAVADFRALLFKDAEDFLEIRDGVPDEVRSKWRNGKYLTELEAKKKQDAAIAKL